jgi:hypothetical protein
MKLKNSYARSTVTLAILIVAVVLSAVFATLSYADSLNISFESPAYTTGSINGQQGWMGSGIPINPLIDQSVVANGAGAPASFGGQSWRFSNAYVDGAFGDWPFSPSLSNEAGESQAQNNGYSGGVRQTHYEVQWDVASAVPGAEQPGLKMSTASDRGDGARMTYIRMEDGPGGLNVFFDDYEDRAPYGSPGTPATAAAGCGLEDDFIEYQVASNLSRLVPHTIKLTIDFVDGPRNDVVKVYVDGTLRQTGTTWEDYYRWCTESGGGTGLALFDQSRTVDSQIFQARSGGGACASCAGNGFLIDNLSFGSSQPPTSANQCKSDGWQNRSRTDGSTFKNQGDCIQYVNTGK